MILRSLVLACLGFAVRGQTIRLGGLFPSDWFAHGGERIRGARIAVEKLNADTSFGHVVNLTTVDDAGDGWTALRAVCEIGRRVDGVHAIVGPAYSRASVAVAPLCAQLQLPCLSFASTSVTLADRTEYPYFGRVVPSDENQAQVIAKTIQHWKWERACIVYQDDNYGSQGAIATAAAARDLNIDILALHPFSHKDLDDAAGAIADAGGAGCRIFVLWCIECGKVMQRARDAGYVEPGKYVWIMSEGCSAGDPFKDPADLAHSIVGSLCVAPAAPDGPARQAFLQAWDTDTNGQPGTYVLFAHDATLAAAYAVKAAGAAALASPARVNGTRRCLSDTRQAIETPWRYGPSVMAALAGVSFEGATSGTGQVRFTGAYERAAGTYVVSNMQSFGWDGGTLRQVGVSTGSGKTVQVDFSRDVQWSLDTPTVVPPDRELISMRPIRVMAMMEAAPFNMFNKEDAACATCRLSNDQGCPNQCYKGLAFDFWALVAANRGWTYTIDHTLRGTMSYTQCVNRSLVVEDYDVVVGDFTSTAQRSEFVDIAFQFYDLGLQMLRRKDRDEGFGGYKFGIWAFALPFSNNLWLFTMLYLLLAAFLFWLFERGNNDTVPGLGTKKEENLKVDAVSNSLFWSLTAFFQTHNHAPVTLAGKMLAVSCFLMNTALLCGYTANFASFLTVAHEKAPVGGIGDVGPGKSIAYNEVCLMCTGCSVDGYWNFKTGSGKCYNCGNQPTPTGGWKKKCVQLVQQEDSGVTTMIGDSPSLEYLALQEGDCTLETVGKLFYPQGYSIFTRKGGPLLGPLTTATLTLKQRNEVEKLKDAWFGRASACKDVEVEDDDDITKEQLNMENLGGLLIISGIGIGISILWFCCCEKKLVKTAVRGGMSPFMRELLDTAKQNEKKERDNKIVRSIANFWRRQSVHQGQGGENVAAAAAAAAAAGDDMGMHDNPMHGGGASIDARKKWQDAIRLTELLNMAIKHEASKADDGGDGGLDRERSQLAEQKKATQRKALGAIEERTRSAARKKRQVRAKKAKTEKQQRRSSLVPMHIAKKSAPAGADGAAPVTDWLLHKDTSTGAVYYYSPSKDASVWEKPPGFKEGAAEGGGAGDRGGQFAEVLKVATLPRRHSMLPDDVHAHTATGLHGGQGEQSRLARKSSGARLSVRLKRSKTTAD